MKNTQTTTPAVQLIDGKPYVRVVDLAHAWDTMTSNILATGKPHHVPEEHIRRIDGRVWCSFAGLSYRLKATQSSSRLTRHIREFLDSQDEKPTAAKPKPEPKPTDLGTAALIADARRTASQAITKAREAEEQAEEARDVAYDAKVDAGDNAKSLDALDDRVAAIENDSYRRFDTAMTRLHHVERRQGDNAIELTNVKRSLSLLQWSMAALAVVQTLGRVIRLLRRR